MHIRNSIHAPPTHVIITTLGTNNVIKLTFIFTYTGKCQNSANINIFETLKYLVLH